MVRRAKNPRTPPGPLTRTSGDVLAFRDVVWRIHRTRGSHVLAWDALRTYGPLPAMRFDPQPPPTATHTEGVSYAATDFDAALAEVFQVTGVVDTVSFAPQVTAWVPVRALRLLDLRGTWALRNGASASLYAAARSTCQAWARAIRATWPDLDGLFAPSTMTGGSNVVLWNPAANSFPPYPAFSRPLSHPSVKASANAIATKDLGYRII